MNRIFFLLLIGLTICGCIKTPEIPPVSALEIREMQTRSFAVRDEKLVMKAVLNALQDEGYIAKNAVIDLGLLTATKESDIEDVNSRVWGSIFMGEQARWQKTSVIEANANISKFGDETRLRISFQRKILDNLGNVIEIEDVRDPYFYQEFFAKVDKSIFIQKENI